MAGNDLTQTLARRTGGEYVELPGGRVQLKGPSGKVQEQAIGLDSILVGTSPDCDLVADDPSVSRTHCQLVPTETGVIVRDMRSKNGTLLNGVRILEAMLVPGVVLKLGSSELTLSVQGEPTVVPLSKTPRFGDAMGASVPMRALFAKLERAAGTDAPILLFGESGTGKGLLAEAIHAASPRKDGPFVVFDCAAVAPTLIESELFGYAKGAFTGAVQDREGLLEQANGGTLFIDEIGELPLELQPRLLRVLETKQVRPLGSNDNIAANARIIAATHRDLRSRLASGDFREDLYYRLAVVEAVVPPLRERREDIPLLVEAMLKDQDPPRTLADLPPHALALLESHAWPGNVRELRNTIARLVLFPHLGSLAIGQESGRPAASAGVGAVLARLPLREARDAVIADFERNYLIEKLREQGGNVSAAAKSMGVSRQFAHRLMSRYDIRGRDG